MWCFGYWESANESANAIINQRVPLEVLERMLDYPSLARQLRTFSLYTPQSSRDSDDVCSTRQQSTSGSIHHSKHSSKHRSKASSIHRRANRRKLNPKRDLHIAVTDTACPNVHATGSGSLFQSHPPVILIDPPMWWFWYSGISSEYC